MASAEDRLLARQAGGPKAAAAIREALGNAASNASTGTTIGEAALTLDGLSVNITIDSVWGIDGSGNPYYNAAGAAPGEAAILDVNAVTGEFVICQPNGVVPL